MQNQNEIVDHSSIHNYRTEIPNILLDLDLDPYEICLYLHLKRIAGDKGRCWATNAHLEEKTKMKKRKLIMTKKSLQTKGLIKITLRKKENGSPDTCLIEIIDLWEKNFSQFLAKKNEVGSACDARGVVHVMHEGSACGAPKEEPIEEDLSLKNKPPISPPKGRTKEISPEVESLKKKIYEAIKSKKENFSKSPGTSWSKDCESLLKKRSEKEILAALSWALKDSFWISNILSPAKLLKHIDTIEIRMAQKPSEEDVKEKIERHMKQAQEHEKTGKIYASASYVEFCGNGAGPSRFVNYNVSEEEWVMKTGWSKDS